MSETPSNFYRNVLLGTKSKLLDKKIEYFYKMDIGISCRILPMRWWYLLFNGFYELLSNLYLYLLISISLNIWRTDTFTFFVIAFWWTVKNRNFCVPHCYNHFHNILRLFDVLKIFFPSQVKRCAINTYKHGIYELPHELPTDLRVSILES